MTRLDLDTTQCVLEQLYAAGEVPYNLGGVPLLTLVAELRAARRVVAAATIYHTTNNAELRAEAWIALGDELAAYGRVVGP